MHKDNKEYDSHDPGARVEKLRQYLELDNGLLSKELYAIRDEIHHAMLNERERCAETVEMFMCDCDNSYTARFVRRILQEVAGAIRETR